MAWNAVGTPLRSCGSWSEVQKDEVLAAGNAPAAALVAIKARATILPQLDLVGPPYPRDPVFENIRTSTLFGARACF